MAKGRSSKTDGRDTFDNAIDESMPRPIARPISYVRQYVPVEPLTEIEDFRTYHPAPAIRPALNAFTTQPARLTPGKPSKRSNPRFPSPTVAFADAPQVVVCIRRKIRRNVLHALKKTGRRGQKRPRRGPWSLIRC